MRISRTKTFKRHYRKLPQDIKKAVDKAMRLLVENPHYPSLHTSKVSGAKDWYCRVTGDYRMTFKWHGDEITLTGVGSHDKAL